MQVILTAWQHHKTLFENVLANRELQNYLRNQGIEPTECLGRYNGDYEISYSFEEFNLDKVAKIKQYVYKRYNQQSILIVCKTIGKAFLTGDGWKLNYYTVYSGELDHKENINFTFINGEYLTLTPVTTSELCTV